MDFFLSKILKRPRSACDNPPDASDDANDEVLSILLLVQLNRINPISDRDFSVSESRFCIVLIASFCWHQAQDRRCCCFANVARNSFFFSFSFVESDLELRLRLWSM